MARALDVTKAGNSEGCSGKRLHVNVLNLVPEFDVVDRKIPKQTLADGTTRSQLELPRSLRIELAQIAANLTRRGQLQYQRRFIRAAGIAIELHGGGDFIEKNP